MTVFPVEGPCDGLVELLDGGLDLLGDMAHYRVHNLALVVPLVALDDVFGGDSTLGQINVTLLLVYSENDDNFVPPDADELLNGSNTSSGKFGEQDHAVTGAC